MIDDRVNLVLKVVGENIRRLRGKVTQVGLARKARVSRSTLQKAENGVSVEFDNIIRIAQALGKNPADLFLTDEVVRGRLPSPSFPAPEPVSLDELLFLLWHLPCRIRISGRMSFSLIPGQHIILPRWSA